MKKIITVIIISSLTGSVFSQNIGIGEASPSQKLDVAGWIKVGNESAGTTGTAGTIRYHSSGKLQLHNGSAWVDLSSIATFTNWGRNDCPSGSSVVYAGYVAGGHAGHTGSGANTLCLTNSPVYAVYHDGNHNGNLLYGLEFQASGSYGLSSLVGYTNYDAVCAVCEVNNHSESLMIPGTTNCPSGWTQQYWGYLMADHYTQRKSEYVCVNNTPMATGSATNSGGPYWYPTEVETGALVNGAPYVHDREITCVVCTQ